MKIAVTSTGPTLDDSVEARFGRCAYFLVVDTDTMQCEPIENPNIALGGGAGIQSAQLMSEKGVTTVLTGHCGPNAFIKRFSEFLAKMVCFRFIPSILWKTILQRSFNTSDQTMFDGRSKARDSNSTNNTADS